MLLWNAGQPSILHLVSAKTCFCLHVVMPMGICTIFTVSIEMLCKSTCCSCNGCSSWHTTELSGIVDIAW